MEKITLRIEDAVENESIIRDVPDTDHIRRLLDCLQSNKVINNWFIVDTTAEITF